MKTYHRMTARRAALALYAALLIFALVGGTAQAQTTALPQQPYLPINLALEGASAALAQCQTDGYSVSVAIVDRGGVLKVLLRDDNTGPHTVTSSSRKAYTAASLGRSTSALADTVAGNGALEGLRQMDPQLLILGGGLPIVVNDAIVGGIGVGGAPGGHLDEVCAQAGIDAILTELGMAPEMEATAMPEEEDASATPEAEEEPTATPTP